MCRMANQLKVKQKNSQLENKQEKTYPDSIIKKKDDF